eukprot:TRINITY_DN65339_c0_g1_i1.p1 TRINITY_DN65339_c0_g1~~TRINITY_DN65339_c0_g1_i1.p1  ORF type:complete len:298 (-),score=53.60 TRINITY_DN65339_c0_g1_i1:35-904(-)
MDIFPSDFTIFIYGRRSAMTLALRGVVLALGVSVLCQKAASASDEAGSHARTPQILVQTQRQLHGIEIEHGQPGGKAVDHLKPQQSGKDSKAPQAPQSNESTNKTQGSSVWGAIHKVHNALKNATAGAAPYVSNATDAAGHAMKSAGKAVAHAGGKMWNWTVSTGSRTGTYIGDALGNASEAVWNASNSTALKRLVSETCLTAETDEVDGWFTFVSPAGSRCVFGVDTRDEGEHCIDQGGDHGANGWCWTSEAVRSWGKCKDDCPLAGADKVLADKLDSLEKRLQKLEK